MTKTPRSEKLFTWAAVLILLSIIAFTVVLNGGGWLAAPIGLVLIVSGGVFALWANRVENR